MATITDYRAIVALIDRTFTRHERRLAELREETIAVMREDIAASHLSHLTQPRTAEESSGPVSSER